MTSLSQHIRTIPYTRPYIIMIGAWVLSMVSLPIARWVLGDDVIPVSSFIGVVCQFLAVVLILHQRWETRRTVMTIAIVAVVGWGAEFIGSNTGFPFSHYQYTNLLQPQIAHVPVAIPLAWMMMMGPSWAVAYVIVGRNLSIGSRRLVFIGLSALAMTAWDLYLDPQMVGWGFWVWENPVGYFGIPWVNYLGWLLVSALMTALVRPDNLPVPPLLVIYGIVWILQAIGLSIFWGQPGPALVGFVGMGLMLGAAYLRRDAA